MAFHFDVVTQALDDFEVRGRGNSGAVLQDFTPSSWTSLPANGRILESSGDLAAVAAAGNGYFRMDVGELSEVVVRASAAADSASVTPRWSLQ